MEGPISLERKKERKVYEGNLAGSYSKYKKEQGARSLLKA